jgi:hypothetical protein
MFDLNLIKTTYNTKSEEVYIPWDARGGREGSMTTFKHATFVYREFVD